MGLQPTRTGAHKGIDIGFFPPCGLVATAVLVEPKMLGKSLTNRHRSSKCTYMSYIGRDHEDR